MSCKMTIGNSRISWLFHNTDHNSHTVYVTMTRIEVLITALIVCNSRCFFNSKPIAINAKIKDKGGKMLNRMHVTSVAASANTGNK